MVLSVFEKDEKLYLASSSGDETVKIWDVKDDCLVTTLTGHTSSIYVVKLFYKEDNPYLVTGSNNNTIKV